MTTAEAVGTGSSPLEERKKSSIEGLTAVRKTVTDGIASLRERVAIRPRLDTSVSDPELPGGSDDIITSAVTSGDGSQKKEVDQLNAMLEAAEARGDAAQEEAERLRAENKSLRATFEHSTRMLKSLRADYDRLRAEKTDGEQQDSAALAETYRLRSQVVEMQREVQRVTSRAEEASKSFVEEKKKREALERVCMTLRTRIAVAEEKAQDEKKMQEAVVARELAEAQLVEARVEAEKWRARSSAAEVARERAESAERSERLQREKVATLEKELQSREALLKQGIRERKKLNNFMADYERELEEKEMKLAKLRTFIKHRGYHKKRRGHMDGADVDVELESDDETDLGTNVSLSVDRGNVIENSATEDDWEPDLTSQTDGSRSKDHIEPDSAVSFAVASPLFREVEEAHAQLQAVVQPAEAQREEAIDADINERVRRLEESFERLAQTRNPSE